MTPGELSEELARAAGRAESPIPVLNMFVAVMDTSIQRNFEAEGRPIAWEPTRFPLPNHKATLHNDGTLRASAHAIRDGIDIVLVAGGGNQPPAKAPALQYGAQLHNKRRIETGRFAKRRARKNVYRYGGLLPPRPYLLFQPDDMAYFGDELPSYIFTTVRF